MSELTDKLKVTRGKGYYTVLGMILNECGEQIINDAHTIKASQEGKFTPLNIGQLAKKYDLNFKATCEWLEEGRAIPAGTYERLIERGLKAREVLEAARTPAGREEKIMPKKLTVEEQKEIFPDDYLHQVFLEREDIAQLPPDEQERRWQEQLKGINRFMEWLAGVDAYIIQPPAGRED